MFIDRVRQKEQNCHVLENPQTSETHRETRGRGRPSTIDREAVSACALALWDAKGLAGTSWGDIAIASGVSVRTLVRHFSSKEDLAWVGIPSATTRLKRALDGADRSDDTADVIRRAVVESLSTLERSRASGPQWLHTIAAEPTLRAGSAAAHRPWVQAIEEFIAFRHPAVFPAVRHAIAVAYQVAAFDALLAWADAGARSDMTSEVDSNLRWLRFDLDEASGPSRPSL